MKIKDILKDLKKEYLSTAPSLEFKKSGWKELSVLLDKEPKQHTFYRSFLFRFAVVFFALFFLGGGSILVAAEKAKPGDTLYPVRQISQQAAALVKEIKILPTANNVEEEKNNKQAEDELRKTGEEIIDEPKEDKKEKHQQKDKSGPSSIEDKKDKEDKKIKEVKEKVEKFVEEEVKGKEKKKEKEDKDVERNINDVLKDSLNTLINN